MKITEIDASMEPVIAGRPGCWQIFIADEPIYTRRGRLRQFTTLDAAVNALERVGIVFTPVFYDVDAA